MIQRNRTGRRRGTTRFGLRCGWLLCAALFARPAQADLPLEATGQVEILPEPHGPHWAFAADVILRRSALVDLESGRTLGMVDGGFGITSGLFPTKRREIYVPETHYSRGSRGVRTDVVTIYDASSLVPSPRCRSRPGARSTR